MRAKHWRTDHRIICCRYIVRLPRQGWHSPYPRKLTGLKYPRNIWFNAVNIVTGTDQNCLCSEERRLSTAQTRWRLFYRFTCGKTTLWNLQTSSDSSELWYTVQSLLRFVQRVVWCTTVSISRPSDASTKSLMCSKQSFWNCRSLCFRTCRNRYGYQWFRFSRYIN